MEKKQDRHQSRNFESDEERPVALPKLDGVVVGSLVGWSSTGAPLVDFPGNRSGAPVEARTTVALHEDGRAREVALLFEGSDPMRPICVGILREAGTSLDVPLGNAVETRLDGERLVFTADKEIVLRCGKATIVLTREGRVLLRGVYLLSRSSGINRIKGGSVQIN